MMNICILSMQRVDNFGSLLQAFGLKKALQELGHSVYFLDIKRKEEDYKLIGDFRITFPEEAEKIGKFGRLSKVDRYLFWRLNNKLILKKQLKIYEEFRVDCLNINSTLDYYDLCVIGSDEVFNCLSSGKWGFTTQLFGDVIQADKVITYAASCGETRADNLLPGMAEKIKESFKNISAFSVRDENTLDFVSHFSKKEILTHFDPVLVCDYSKEIESVTLPKLPKRFCIIYSYWNRINNLSEIKGILSFCKEHKLTPIAVGHTQFWCKRFVPCTPFECLKIFEKAAFVITDTFHGTIFSVKFSEKYGVIIRNSNNNKLGDLVERLGIQDHLIYNINELSKIYSIKDSKEKMLKTIEKERELTIEYFKNNIIK